MTPSEPSLQMQALFEAQRSAFAGEPYAGWPTRRDRLQRLRRLLTENERAIEEAIDRDFGHRPAIETQLAEIFPSLEEIKAALRDGRGWMKSRHAPVSKWFLPARGRLLPKPLGVIGIIVPWNYPVFLSVGPMVGALAAGNRVMLKLSEHTPAFADCFAQLCARYFAAEEVAVVLGGPEVAASFSSLPFDHLLFTGSTAVGRIVMSAAAANLTPVTLELGGKSPAVVAPGYPLQRAVTRILAGKLLNAGQTCIAPDYVLVPRGEVERFVTAARTQAARMYPAGLASTDYCSIINERHYRRLNGYLEQAQGAGARIEPLFGGALRDAGARRLAPVLIVNPELELNAMQEEIFGPLLPLVPYDRLDEAVAFIAKQPRPLALYWFDRDEKRVQWALRNTLAGGVSVNDTLLHIAQDALPFGGIGPSGMGHYHGRWGFDTFSKLKPIFRQAHFNAMGLFLPPYRPLARRLLELMKRL
ncbi:MAG: coniferyl aldehyde dehydrogenase [Gemmatimonadota bacterium]